MRVRALSSDGVQPGIYVARAVDEQQDPQCAMVVGGPFATSEEGRVLAELHASRVKLKLGGVVTLHQVVAVPGTMES